MKKRISVFSAFCVVFFFVFAAFMAWYIPSVSSVRSKIEQTQRDLDTSRGREDKQQAEYNKAVEELPVVILRPAVGGSHLRELCVVITVDAVVLVRIVLVVGATLSLDVGENPLHRVIDGVVCSVGCAGVGVDLSGEGVGLWLLAAVSRYEGGALGA